MTDSVLQLDPRDNVLVALKPLRGGTVIHFGDRSCTVTDDIPAKHKIAIADLAPGDLVYLYGMVVGEAIKVIPRGGLISTRTIRHRVGPYTAKRNPVSFPLPDPGPWTSRSFQGYRRADGQVGTRNYWIVLPLVFCESRNIGVLKQAFEEELGLAVPQGYRSQVAELARLYRNGRTEEIKTHALMGDAASPRRSRLFENVDGVRFLLHEGGCGGTREDSSTLCGLIAGYIHHPNVAGATVLSLGCQHAQIAILRAELRKRNPNFDKPLVIVEQQQSGTESAMLTEAIRETFLGLMKANECRRVSAPLSSLCVGLKCGGSDGFSGLSTNPAIGHTSDLLAALGGKTILSEFPELCGVEQDLIDRSESKEVGDRFMHLMTSYNARAKAVGSGFEMNPSPGNMRDGLLTDAMKSAGAAKKGGTSPVTAVLDYPEYATE